MNDEHAQREAFQRGEKARAILESDLWLECWALYEARIVEEFKACRTDDVARMQQLKMLHLAGIAAQKHLEAVLTDGKFASANIEFVEKENRFKRAAKAFAT